MTPEALQAIADSLRSEISNYVIGQSQGIDLLLIALISKGHVLLEGVPGVGKTYLAKTFAAALGLDFGRIQFTPDLMPGDVLGSNLFDFQQSQFKLIRGPIFTQVLLADEINRTPPKTQSALLEAMQERKVTLDGKRHDLGDGFMVVATQNPIEHEGTYPLPEAQLDRFLFRIEVGYPNQNEEHALVATHGNNSEVELGLEAPLISFETIQAARRLVSNIQLAPELIDYLVELVRATRANPAILTGASPRAATMLAVASRAQACLRGRDYVIPDDIQELFLPAIAHRVTLSPGAEIEGVTSKVALSQILERTPTPR